MLATIFRSVISHMPPEQLPFLHPPIHLPDSPCFVLSLNRFLGPTCSHAAAACTKHKLFGYARWRKKMDDVYRKRKQTKLGTFLTLQKVEFCQRISTLLNRQILLTRRRVMAGVISLPIIYDVCLIQMDP